MNTNMEVALLDENTKNLEEIPGKTSFKVESWRAALYDELHARPFPVIETPIRVSQIAVLREPGSDGLKKEHQHLLQLCQRYSANAPAENASCYFNDLGEFELRWEQHTEFSTYTFLRKGSHDYPFEHHALALLPKDWLESLPGEVVAATHVTLENFSDKNNSPESLNEKFEGQRKIAASVLDGKTEIWTALRLHSDGFGRYMIYCDGLNSCETGRLLQRVLEIETYRLLSLMALPLAREVSPGLTLIENELAVLTKKISQIEEHDDRELLNRLSTFAADVEHARAKINFRITATRAYHALVMERLAELHQNPVQGLQTLSAFLDRRLTPAVRTCEAVWDRLENISQRIDRATDLIRTEVDLTIEEQNQSLLDSMNRRGKIQLRMQQTFEGLSAVAICYYLVGLVEQAIPGLESLGFHIDHKILLAVAIPVSLLAVIGFNKIILHRIRKETGNH